MRRPADTNISSARSIHLSKYRTSEGGSHAFPLFRPSLDSDRRLFFKGPSAVWMSKSRRGFDIGEGRRGKFCHILGRGCSVSVISCNGFLKQPRQTLNDR